MTRIAHLGIECCRACSVFYRYLLLCFHEKLVFSDVPRRNAFVCRNSTGQCKAGKGLTESWCPSSVLRITDLNCKRCRFDRIVSLLGNSDSPHNVRDSIQSSKSRPVYFRIPNTPIIPIKLLRSCLHLSARSWIVSSLTTGLFSNTSWLCLDDLCFVSSAMSFSRLTSELLSRTEPPHPIDICLETGVSFAACSLPMYWCSCERTVFTYCPFNKYHVSQPFVSADVACLPNSVGTLLTAALEFGRNTFPEFVTLDRSEKVDTFLKKNI